MRIIPLHLILPLLFMVGCSSTQNFKKHIKARVTWYCAAEDSKWKNKIATSNELKAQEGRTVAVNPHEIPYFSHVFIPFLQKLNKRGVFIAEDTGSALLSRKASHGQYTVIDIYVSSRKKMLTWQKISPPYLDAFIF